MKKRVTLYFDPDDTASKRVEKFLTEQDVILKVHDIKTRPLDLKQISKLLRNFDIKHFYNSNGHSAGKKKTSEPAPVDRNLIMEKMAADNSLLRLPIILSERLLTVGHNTDRIGIMLQITPGSEREPRRI